jgi:hypothetical protein
MHKPENKKLNQWSFWLCWTILCLGLGYAWASGSYRDRIGKLESLVVSYQVSQLEQAIDKTDVTADKNPKIGMKPKNW